MLYDSFIYFDNMLLAKNNLEPLEGSKTWVSSIFKIKGMGEASYILGVIIRNRSKKLLDFF